jgi:hypothetical protein
VLKCDLVPCGLPAKVGPNGRPNGKGMCTRHYNRGLQGKSLWTTRPHALRGREWATYHQMHRRIQKALGKASQQSCVDCGGQAREWSYNGSGVKETKGFGTGVSANILMTYSLDINQYDPRCRKCHFAFDKGVLHGTA